MMRVLRAAVIALAAIGLAAGPRAYAASLDARPAELTWAMTEGEIASACDRELARSRAAYERILDANTPRTFTATLIPLAEADEDLNDGLVAPTFLQYVSPDEDLRHASAACGVRVAELRADERAKPELYAALAAVAASGTAANDADKQLLQYYLTQTRRAGAALARAQRNEFVAISKRLSAYSTEYRHNLDDDDSTISVDVRQVAGLSPDFLSTLKRDSKGYVVPVNESTVDFVMKSMRDADVRKRFYFAYERRGGEENVQILRDALAARDRLAHLMGYPSWAAFAIEDRMAKTPERVRSFLETLRAGLLPRSRGEIVRLAKLKAEDQGTASPTIEAWDWRYYDEMLHRTRYAVDSDAIRRYFPAEHTIEAVLAIYQRIFGITFRRVEPANAWAPGVLRYAVYDGSSGAYLGEFYLDLYPRPGKYDHFATFQLLPSRRLADGTFRARVAAIVGNWPPPAPGRPSLLSHSDVVVFFHEFGHNMAGLLSASPYSALAGYKRDFVEAPSMMLENFVWEPAVLRQISSDVDGSGSLPDDTIAKMVAARSVDGAIMQSRQVAFATYDLALHTSGPHVDPIALWSQTVAQTTAAPLYAPGSLFPASFGHLFGYDAGYYSYQWSLVYAQDMYTAFKADGVESPRVGMRYRKDILEPGLIYDADAEVQRFLGRPMRTDAYYAYLGIAAPR